ncbi:SEC-C domain-containing protein [Streptacidiphilus monticola]
MGRRARCGGAGGSHLLRAQHLRDGGAWNVVAEMFETAGELAEAAEWFTVAITRLMGPATPLTVEAVEQLPYEYDIETLVIGRHRVRRRLGSPHDALDGLADQLHEHRNRWQDEVTPLDRLHDPALEEQLLREQIEALKARNQQLSDEVASRRAGLARPQLMCALYWPQTEFAQLLARWPSLVDVYGDDHLAHRSQVERTLSGLSDQGGVHLAVAPGTVSGLEEFAREEGVAPDASEVRAQYAADLGQLGRAVAWPPPRNGACWCGSGRKYKKCCGNPVLT